MVEHTVQNHNKPKKRIDCLIAVAINIALLYVINNLLSWHVPYLTTSFAQVIPILKYAITATIIANLFFYFYDNAIFYQAVHLVLNVLVVAVLYTLLNAFPFNFSGMSGAETLDSVLRIGLMALIFATLLTIIIKSIRFLTNLIKSVSINY